MNEDEQNKNETFDQRLLMDRVVRRLEQVGIDVRITGRTATMQRYIQHLKEELRITEQFMAEDGNPANDKAHP